MKVPCNIYAVSGSLLEKMNTCHNNPEKFFIIILETFCSSLFTHVSSDTTQNRFDYYRDKNCMRNFCLDLKEHVAKLINYEKKRNEEN